MEFNALRFIYNDQLSFDLPTLKDADPKKDLLIFIESMNELTYVAHHKKKIVFWLSCMRHFEKECQSKGFKTLYIDIDHKDNKPYLVDTLISCISDNKAHKLILTEPSEFRQLSELKEKENQLTLPTEILEDDRFFCSKSEFENWAKDKKQIVMEFFYRKMRAKTGFLMDQGEPKGGQWNYDKENRKTLKKAIDFLGPKHFKTDEITQSVIDIVEKKFVGNFGEIRPFWFGVTRKQALEALDHFVFHSLSQFGDYQDCMLDKEPFLYHSLLSHYINIGLLHPYEVCKAAQDAYDQRQVPLNACEGFIRQILGWREFIRGIYWLKMPGYSEKNYFNHQNKLPDFYWSAQTKMNCIRHVVEVTKTHAHSHHIQRLMITGNLALLMGVLPKSVCDWYLAVYADAYDWVELPNTLGMALFADGGVLATKPYAASGNYIHKMSNFCQNCSYNVKEKLGDRACPFNYLYWNFLIENQEKLRANRRLSFAYKALENKSPQEIAQIKKSAKEFIKAPQ